MPVPLYQVDAFTNEPMTGNPAAVCLLDERASEAWMQGVAAEMNLSETAFLVPRSDGFDLRWFTPMREVDLCGHATVASAHVLWETGDLAEGERARFHTASGELGARRDEGGWVWLDFPDESVSPVEAPEGLVAALGAVPEAVARNRLDLLVELASEEEVVALEPDVRAVAELDTDRGVIVTAESREPDVDYVCRYFAPAFGIVEDPATGSIQCALGPWWADRLGKKELRGAQRSARGGLFRVRPEGDRVAIGGQAVTVLRGELAAGADPV